jgi:ABC-2 type transport system ATP-binding protein
VKQLLTDFGGVSSVRLTSQADEGKVAALIEAAADTDLCPALARAVTEKGWDLFELRRLHASLEDVFIDLVTEEAEEDTSAGETEGKEVA